MIRHLVLAGLLVLVGVTAAHAECAWMLWRMIHNSGTPESPESWEAFRGFASRADCVAGARIEASRYSTVTKALAHPGLEVRNANEDLAGGSIVTLVVDRALSFDSPGGARIPGIVLTHEVRCLPDTVDLRAPKATGR